MLHLLTKSKLGSIRGFTVVELIVTITVSGLLMTTLFGPLSALYDDNTKGLKSVIKVADTKGALRSIETSIALSYSFYDTNQIPDPFGTIWSWAGTGPNNRVLITSSYATDINRAVDTADARVLVKDSSCTVPLLNNDIYFVSGGTLYRRTLKNPDATCGSIPIAQPQTCAAGFLDPACTGTDAVLLSNVTHFSIDYYGEADEATAMANQYTTPTVPSAAKAIVITLTASSGPGANDTTTTSKVRIARINGGDL